MKWLALVVLALGLASVAPAQGRQRYVTEVAYPAQAELAQFPVIWIREPSVVEGRREMARLDLRLDTLETAWTGYNWHRDLGRFVLETLSGGTPVYVDAAGNPRYKADCFNRLVELAACPACGSPLTRADSLQAGLLSDSTSLFAPGAKKGFWASLSDWLKGAAGSVWGGLGGMLGSLGWLVALLLGLLLIPILLYFLGRLIQSLWRNRGGGGGGAPAPVTPAPVVPTPVRPAPVVPPASVPHPVAPISYLRYDAPRERGQDATIRSQGFGYIRVENWEEGETVIRFRPRER